MIASGALSEEEVRRSAEIIKSESDRIATIIRQLLDIARRRSPDRNRVDVGEVVGRSVDLMRPLAEKRRVTIKFAAATRCPIHVDAAQLQQVMTNLLVNAIDAMPDGGVVDVDLYERHLSPPDSAQAAERNYLLISVRDHGRGIPPEDLEQIFEPFFTTKDVGEGTGLGLAIAQGIVEEHGGWMGVASEVGRGSCFTVHLPFEVDP
jgi:signal transduction histidine kinase